MAYATVFCVLRKESQGLYSFFILALWAETSIIKHSGFDSFEAATALFVIS